MDFLELLPTGDIPDRVFWCARNAEKLENVRINNVLERHIGALVNIVSFDAFALQLAEGLLENFNAESIPASAKARGEAEEKRYGEQLLALQKDLAPSGEEANTETKAAATALKEFMAAWSDAPAKVGKAAPAPKPWYRWEFEASSETDPGKRDTIYQQSITALAKSGELANNYAAFLTDVRRDHDGAEALYKIARQLDPSNANVIVNLASLQFLQGHLVEGLDNCAAALKLDGGGSQISAEALVYLALASEGDDKQFRSALARLKWLLAKGFERLVWDFSPWLEKFGPTMPPQKFALIQALVKTIADVQTLPALESFDVWCAVVPEGIGG